MASVYVNNRIDDPSLVQVLADLKEKLLQHYSHTTDVVPHDNRQDL